MLPQIEQAEDKAKQDRRRTQHEHRGMEHLPTAMKIEHMAWRGRDEMRCADQCQHHRPHDQARGNRRIEQRDKQVRQHRQPGEHQQPVVRRTEQRWLLILAGPQQQIESLSQQSGRTKHNRHPAAPRRRRAQPGHIEAPRHEITRQKAKQIDVGHDQNLPGHRACARPFDDRQSTGEVDCCVGPSQGFGRYRASDSSP